MKDIIGEDKDEFEESDISEEIISDLELISIAHTTSELGIFCPFSKSLAFSKEGKVMGVHVTKENNFQLIKMDMDSKEHLLYNFTHTKYTTPIFLIENKNKVIVGGNDGQVVVYDFTSGEILKLLYMGLQNITMIFATGSLGCIGMKSHLKFFDVDTLEMLPTSESITISCEYANSIAILTEEDKGENIPYLLSLGLKSLQITKTPLLGEFPDKDFELKSLNLLN